MNKEIQAPSFLEFNSSDDINACYIQCCIALYQVAKNKDINLEIGEFTGYVQEMMLFLVNTSKHKTNYTDDWILSNLAEHVLSQNDKLSKLNNKINFTPLLKKEGLNNYNLSERELECLRLIAEGKTVKESAHILQLSPRTVETYLNNIKAKLRITSKSELLKIYWNSPRGLARPPIK